MLPPQATRDEIDRPRAIAAKRMVCLTAAEHTKVCSARKHSPCTQYPPRGGAVLRRLSAGQELVDEVLRVPRELTEDDAHAVLLDANDLADPFDRLDGVHDDG